MLRRGLGGLIESLEGWERERVEGERARAVFGRGKAEWGKRDLKRRRRGGRGKEKEKEAEVEWWRRWLEGRAGGMVV